MFTFQHIICMCIVCFSGHSVNKLIETFIEDLILCVCMYVCMYVTVCMHASTHLSIQVSCSMSVIVLGKSMSSGFTNVTPAGGEKGKRVLTFNISIFCTCRL